MYNQHFLAIWIFIFLFSVGHQKMLEFICDKTATPYFSNLIWLIGKDAIELDDCVLQETE